LTASASETLPFFLLGKAGKPGTNSVGRLFLAQARERGADTHKVFVPARELVNANQQLTKERMKMAKGKRTNEQVEVVAHSVRYGVQDERLQTAISGFEIRQQDEPPARTDSCITVEFGPTVSKASAIAALRMVLEKIEAEGLPALVTSMEKRAATRLVKLQKDAVKASKLLEKLPPEVRDNVKRTMSLDL
jgi:hypothetical protein